MHRVHPVDGPWEPPNAAVFIPGVHPGRVDLDALCRGGGGSSGLLSRVVVKESLRVARPGR